MTDEVLRLDAVTFRRNGKEILHGIDLAVHRGEHWALLGPNGAGKSTILGFCGAQAHPTTGTVDVLGHRLGRVDMQELRRHIGHVNPRHPIRSALSATDVVLTGFTGTVEPVMRWTPSGPELERAAGLLGLVGLDERTDVIWPTMSQGERGRALIARALAAAPALLLLDEPTTGLDVAAREQLLETIDELSHTEGELASILVTHHLEELPESITHAMIIAEGSVLAAGPVGETITSEIITEAFRHPIDVGHDGGRWSARARRRAAV
ncbi:ABC transporter ATP-binding protein [Microbacterium tumbae]